MRGLPALLPAGAFYGSGSFDSDLGFYLPDTPVIYNKTRYLERKPNLEGFMDIDHGLQKAPETVRMGFFGDSYVESIQVPLASVFFRRLPKTLAGRTIEPMGFGISGLGTLHSLLLYRKYGHKYNLDIVVYVFVHNDPGDHFYEIQKARGGLSTARPTAQLSEGAPGFEIKWSPLPREKPLYIRGAMYIKNRSLLARVIYSRLKLLTNPRRMAELRHLEVSPSSRSMPTQETPPDRWPEPLLAEARTLTRNILQQMKTEVEEHDRKFFVLYVPRGSAELEGRIPVDASWRSWLDKTCSDLGVSLIDPTEALRARHEAGDAIYGDHWTPEGHEVVASVLASKLQLYLEGIGDLEGPAAGR